MFLLFFRVYISILYRERYISSRILNISNNKSSGSIKNTRNRSRNAPSWTTAALVDTPLAPSSEASVPSPIQRGNIFLKYYNLEMLKNNDRAERNYSGKRKVRKNVMFCWCTAPFCSTSSISGFSSSLLDPVPRKMQVRYQHDFPLQES